VFRTQSVSFYVEVCIIYIHLYCWTLAELFYLHFSRVEQVNKDSVETFFNNHISFLRDTFGVLLFLYTVMCSKVN